MLYLNKLLDKEKPTDFGYRKMNAIIKMAVVAAMTTTAAINLGVSAATASTFTKTSPTSQGLVPTGISEVGGVVLDLVGSNGARVVSQLSASNLFEGWSSYTPNTLIGTQTGFNTSILSALGGSLKEVGVRFSLYDGDTAAGNFDLNDNSLLVNGINFGNWSAVNAQNTDSLGNATALGFSSGGFRNNTLDTGWFYLTDAAKLTSFFDSLSSGQVVYQLNDIDPGDQYLDFKQGIATSLTNVSLAPTVTIPTTTSSIPEPSTALGLLVLSFLGVRTSINRQQKSTVRAKG